MTGEVGLAHVVMVCALFGAAVSVAGAALWVAVTDRRRQQRAAQARRQVTTADPGVDRPQLRLVTT